MALQDNLILHLPLDESAGSTTAYDYSPSHANGTVSGGAQFETGKNGNCLNFAGKGECDVASDIVDFSDDFSILAWISRNSSDGHMSRRIGILVAFESEEPVYIERWYAIQPEAWMHWAIVRDGDIYRIFVNGTPTDTVIMDEGYTPKGVSIVDDYYSSDAGDTKVDDVRIYSTALSADDIASVITSTAANTIDYIIDGQNIKTLFDIYVSKSDGLLDRPKMKPTFVANWPSRHGEIVNLMNKRVEPRDITLECFIKATSKMEFVSKINNFIELIGSDGTHRLMVVVHPTKPLVYEVYAPDGISIDKRWNDSLMVGTFKLRLREPDPVKRVLMYNAITDDMTASITVTSPKNLTVFWGDGTKTEDIYGVANTVTHEYQNSGVYYIIVAGVIEDIASFSTNAVIVWQRI